MSGKWVIGVDLGGTKLCGAILNERREKIAYFKRPTKSYLGIDETITRILELIEQLLIEAKIDKSKIEKHIKAIGFGVPGPVDRQRGVIRTAPNLGWKNIHLKSIVEGHFGVPVIIENDVNAGTFGEYRLFLDATFQNVIGVFVGTGIGGGIVLNGQIFTGATGAAGEIGHMVIKEDGALCGCGNKGCFEAHASKSALQRRILEDIEKKKNVGYVKKFMVPGQPFVLKSSQIVEAIALRDRYMVRRVKKMGAYLGIGIANLVNVFDPEAIVLGGGVVSSLKETLLSEMRHTFNRSLLNSAGHTVDIRMSQLGDDAVMMGAAILAAEL